ncbi:MAG: 50S ribosomal protein L18 [Candidatus Lindowbacteria bacterium RIFCSPLOWO2_12_FULL_62_27]|nr:ribosomal protein L18 [uncultured bacterium]OGH59723.1 MAG: 50S ribosomal protein L18 [Candidatus Lindowbacteria bacterium RIFCSPLOWO2_12_FULL_62_27]OGH63573.1 MAG: 50S ribosomal protein L18 [Candidatus Lindowbacteria bacterium RIFCSPLOWO2_02_FULL_62_12]
MGDKRHGEVTAYKSIRSRKRVIGTSDRPRLCVFKSRKHIAAQVVDDLSGLVLLGASTRTPEVRDVVKGKKNKEACKAVGKLIAERCAAKGIRTVRFDRSGYIYHGKIAALADSAREGGLQF